MPQRATFKVPRLYKAAANVAKIIKEENGNLEQLVEKYNNKTNAKALTALVTKCLTSENMLDRIIENSEILIKEKFDSPWIVRVLITELLLGKQRLPVGSKQIQTVLAYGPVLRTELLKAQGKLHGKQKKSKSDPTVKDSYDNLETELTEDSKKIEFGEGEDFDMKQMQKKRKKHGDIITEEQHHQTKKQRKDHAEGDPRMKKKEHGVAENDDSNEKERKRQSENVGIPEENQQQEKKKKKKKRKIDKTKGTLNLKKEENEDSDERQLDVQQDNVEAVHEKHSKKKEEEEET